MYSKIMYNRGLRQKASVSAATVLEAHRLRLGVFNVVHILVAVILSYITNIIDIVLVFQYGIGSGSAWWVFNTLACIFSPGIIHCMAENFAVYKKPVDPSAHKFKGVKSGERPSLYTPRRFSLRIQVILYIANVLQLRTLIEAFLSLKWRFVTEGFLDARVLQGLAGSLPQIAVQTWILYSTWLDTPDWQVYRYTFASIAFSALNIFTMPHTSPCFEYLPPFFISRKRTLDAPAEDQEGDAEDGRKPAADKEKDNEDSRSHSRSHTEVSRSGFESHGAHSSAPSMHSASASVGATHHSMRSQNPMIRQDSDMATE